MKKQRHVESEVGRRSRSRSHCSPGLFGLLPRRRHSVGAALVLTALLGVWLLLSSEAAQGSEPSLILAAYNMPVEGGSAADLVVALDRPAGPDGVVVDFTVSGGTATRGTDYTMKFTSVEIAPGASARANVITPIDDAAYEGDETIILVAESPSLTLTSNTLTLTISDNELPSDATLTPTTTPTPTPTPTPSPDRAALVAIYNATNGPNWLPIENWLSDKPIRLWERVYTDHNNRVTTLYLGGYGLSGSIPWEHLTKLTELRYLELDRNQLSGSIPPELGRLTKLEDIRLQDNLLSGSIPSELSNLTKLQYLYLDGNQLSGSIPPELGRLTKLQDIRLQDNRLSGSIPSELSNLTKLQDLYLDGNQLSGSIPPELGSLAELQILDIEENQLTGSIPSELGSLTSLEVLHLARNQFTGSIPSELGSLTNLESLYLGRNQLTGSIPSELGSLTSLEALQLEENQLSGSIPSELGSLTNLVEFRLQGNQLSGSIPSELGNLTNLETFYLNGNQLTGSIPSELGNLHQRVNDFRLSGNRLKGCVPRSLRSDSIFVLVDEGIGWCEVEPGPDSPVGAPTVSALITKMKEWRNDACCVSDKEHTDRWDRALLAFGETVADTSLSPMTADEAQEFADRGWTRWVEVTAALRELESGAQQDPPNSAPTVSTALGNIIIVSESGTKQVSLSGVFSDADNDALTITAGSSDEAKATVSVASDGSSLTVNAQSRGTVTITVTADDGNGGTVSDTFTVRVKAAPVVASAIGDLSLELGGDQDISLSDVFSDADGDALTFTATSTDLDVANALEFHGELTIIGGLAGSATVTVTAEDTDGNRVSDAFEVSVARAPMPTPTPTPTPTPMPTPEPPADSSLKGAAARYDANGDGKIDLSEYRRATNDYADGKISYAEMLEVLMAYRASG